MSAFGVLVSIVVAVIAYHAYHGPELDPPVRIEDPLPELVRNNKLANAERLFEGHIAGPESFTEDKEGRIYTGLADGRIIRFNADATAYEVFARTGAAVTGCGTLDMEPVCGRPLAMAFDSAENLIVADAYKGLLLVDREGNITPLASEAEKQPFLLLNGLAIGPDGIIYVTESSRRWPRRRIIYESIEGNPTGRLMAYNPETKQIKVLARDLLFPNGICLSHDQKHLMMVSTTGAKVYTFDLQTHKLRAVAQNLPGLADNIVRHPNPAKKTYLVSMGSRRAKPFSLPHFLAPYPAVKKVLVRIVPYMTILKLVPKHSFLVEMDDNGSILNTFQDPTGRTPWISEVHLAGEHLYLGSWLNPFLARVPAKVLDE